MVLAGVIPTGGRLVLEPASYPVKVESLRPLLGMVPAAVVVVDVVDVVCLTRAGGAGDH